MPNKRSAAKRVRQSEKRRLMNKARKSSFKNAVKKLMRAMEEGKSGEDVMELFKRTQKLIDKAAQKGAIHKNTASRKKRRLAAKVNRYLEGVKKVG